MRERDTPGRADHERADLVLGQLAFSPDKFLQYGNDKGKRLAGASNSFNDHVLMPHEEWNGGRLHRGHLGVSHGMDYI